MSGGLDTLIGALAGAPSLPGARCRGRAHLFDPADPTEPADTAQARHRQALGLCQRCPSLNRCRDWLDTLPRGDRPPGVVAAMRVDERGRIHPMTIPTELEFIA